MVKFDCPKCLGPLTFRDEHRGSEVRCPKCQTRLRLPGKPPPATKPEPAARSAKPVAAVKPARPKPPPTDDVDVIDDVEVVRKRPKRPPPSEDHVIDDAEVVRKPRRRKKRRRQAESVEMPEWVIPLGVLLFAGVMNALLALRGDPDEGRARLIFTLISLVVTVPLAIVGLYIAAAAMGANYGNVFTAAIKIAAITTVVQCIYTFGMQGSEGASMILVLMALPVYYGMFMWFFELTFMEAFCATFFIGLVQRVVLMVLMFVIIGIQMKAAMRGQ
jgi:hypothetical protein